VVLQPQELIITLFGEYVDPPAAVWSGGLVSLLGDLGFSTAASRIALGRIVARGLLERTKQGRRVYYAVTPRLSQVLREGHRQTFWFRYPAEPWEGRWTIVWYAIPDEHRLARRRFSRRLNFLGFGPLQDGTWIAPHDREAEVTAIVDQLDIAPHVLVFVGRPSASLELSQICARAWDLEQLRLRYAAFVKEFAPYRRRRAIAKLSDRDAFIARTRALETFRQLAPQEPKLPDSALRQRWKRQGAIECFDDVERVLHPGASRYFAVSTDPHADHSTPSDA
jgi:phenylacetic acid degradation operon negative regulatory protein